MSTTLPVPITFKLPEGWQAAAPDAAGAPGAAFVAVHPFPDSGFTANITIDGEYRPDTATLAQIADESVERLRAAVTDVHVVDRQEVGSPGSPGLTQTLEISALAGGVTRELVQSQVYLAMLDEADASKRAVTRLVLTATAAQFPAVVGDFQEFMSTVRPDTDVA
ncbi:MULTISPECIES: DUF1795 domain-containing protein [Streptomyces]|uniref:DUF1795 domain-containing protein n=1 Tax=Streptomyces TaxID=1883 RepID=UPI002109064B|nr:DUF1795 domain-containing protein [Streptomyces longispororuber]MCQ4206847.1 DUF1795 domain-containing protein [Streptomyces longispororuber]